MERTIDPAVTANPAGLPARRDPRLSDLVAEDHEGFILARAITRAPRLSDVLVAHVYAWCDATLFPHFALEERLLVPALCEADDADGLAVADRLLRDHTFIREDVLAARGGDVHRLRAFAALLTEHVRFEQQEVFPACERLLSERVLDRVHTAKRQIRRGHVFSAA